jgi:hypothetical protein
MVALRAIVAIATSNPGFKPSHFRQADVKTAYLHAPLDSKVPVFLKPPKGHPDREGGIMWQLRKAVYGLPEAGREFEKFLSAKLQMCGWVPTIYSGVFAKFSKDKPESGFSELLFAFVDDLLLYDPSGGGDRLFAELGRAGVTLEMNGTPRTLIGVDFTFSADSVLLSQARYCLSIVVPPGRVSASPLPHSVAEEDDNSELLSAPAVSTYRSLLGSFAYLALTRPDLCFAISFLGKFSSAPTERSLRLLEGAVRYARATSSRGICYKIASRVRKGSQTGVSSDSNWGGAHGAAVESRPENGVQYLGQRMLGIRAWCDASFGHYRGPYAQMGYAICLGGLGGGLVEWKSGKQSRVAHSTLRAECESLHKCVDRVMTLCFFLRQLGFKVDSSIFTDSFNLVTLLSKPNPRPGEDSFLPELLLLQRKLAGCADSISDKDVRAAVVPLMAARDLVADCALACGVPTSVIFIPGTVNPADVLTKSRDVQSLASLAGVT